MNSPEETISATIEAALRMSMDRSARSQQTTIGPSDLGWCRQKAALVTRQIPKSDSRAMWAAQVGTYVHNGVEAALAEVFPEWQFGSINNVEVTAAFPSGAEIVGHPDIVTTPTDLNAVLDIKTVDGLTYVQRHGASQSHRYQRHTYALGAIQGGLLDDTKPVYVGNIYLDRSGKESQPLVLMEEFDPLLTVEIDHWISDVIYAAQHGEDAARDVPSAVCEKVCEYFTVCRGGLEDTDDDLQVITDPDLLNAVAMYDEGRKKENEGKALKATAREMLVGVSGATDEFQVRWVHVNETEVAGFIRPASDRLDVVKLRKRAR